MSKAKLFLEMIKDFHTKSLVGRKFHLRGGYDIEVVSQHGAQIIGNLLENGKKSGNIRKYKLDNLEYLIDREIS